MASGDASDLEFLPREDSFLPGGRFRLLNEERDVPPAEYGHAKPTLLWDYHFHYFDGLLAPETEGALKERCVADWLEHVPHGSTPAWDPYPISRRTVSWIKWVLTASGTAPAGMLDSLASQVEHLERRLEFHLLGNHLLTNAIALGVAGSFFGGRSGDRWLSVSRTLLDEQLEEQFLEDGAHFELSPTYHALLLEDLLDLRQIADHFAVGISAAVDPAIRRALDWLARVTRPDGLLPLFNDAAYGVASEPAAIADYARRLGFPSAAERGIGLDFMEPSGYFRYEAGGIWLLGDVGRIGPSYQPGHGHCDMLSFELCFEGRPMVVDPGVSTYERGPRRLLERGTASHNTVQLGSLEQSEIWAAFRVARRATVESVSTDRGGLVARIRAFPPLWARLERSWRWLEDGLEIVDRQLAPLTPGHPATARLHFHPTVRLSGGDRLWMASGLRIRVDDAIEVRRGEYEYSRGFNLRETAPLLEFEFKGRLRTRFET